MQVKISTRLVFIFKTFVIKIPIDKRGWLQGLNERQLWSKYKSNKLVPVIWGVGGIVSQSRANQLHQLSSNDVRIVKNEIPELDVKNCDLYKVENWGVFKGRKLLVDYGITEQISKMYDDDNTES